MYMMRSILTLLAVIVISAGSIAQNRYSRSADESFNDQQYFLALKKYQKAYSKVKKNKDERERISFQMAECYRLMNNPKRSETAYKRLLTSKLISKQPKIYLFYADALKANGNYEEALKQYEAYKEKVPGDPLIGALISATKDAIDWQKNPSKYDVILEKKINTRDAEFAPAYADKNFSSIIFTSDRDASTGKDIDNWTGQDFTDIFLARKDKKGDWSTPALLESGGLIDTKANEGAGQFNRKFLVLYFTRCWNDEKKKNGCAIYKVSRTGVNNWGEPEKIDLGGDSSNVYGHPTVSGDETMIIFSSDVMGGRGGKDLWMAKRKSKTGAFGRPENLGSVINTPGDELFPFLRDDSTLYFASNGIPGMGGLDIYRSIRENGHWTKPENMKYPMNSSSDDFAIVFNLDEPEEGYFTSNRPGGKGKDDIYSFIIPPVYFTLTGTITDDRTLQPVAGAQVSIIGTNGKTAKYTTDERGNYSFNKNQILSNNTYDITVIKKDYFNEKARETTVGVEKSKDFVRDIILRPIPKKPVVLPDILYDLAKWDLKPQFQDSLQGLIETLDANENIVIELASHTDSRDTEERNDVLSQKRAQSVVDYLITRGIDPDRLVAKGYGERVPRTLNRDITREGYTFKTGTVLTDSVINLLPSTAIKEAAHALNRRTEFSILRNDFIPKTTPITAKPHQIEVVTEPEENSIEFTQTKENIFQSTCFVNGSTVGFEYDPTEKDFFISSAEALKLLKSGAISKEDFEGDPTKIIGEGSIADKSVFNIKELKVGRNTINDVKATVSKKVPMIRFGENTMKLFGTFQVDMDDSKIIFE
jgi:peptidoglycan-associated lipoprotein